MRIFKNFVIAALFLGFIINSAAADDNIIYPKETQFTAEENLIYPTGTLFIAEGIPLNSEPEYNFTLHSSNNKTLEEYLIEQCMNHATEINIFSYNIPLSNIKDTYYSFATRHPELLIHTQLRYSITSNNIICTITPTYIFSTVDEDNAARQLMQKKINEYVELAKPFKNPLEKLLAVHDAMVQNYEYDTSYSNISYHAYGIFSNNTAVCQGYSQAFYMITRELGIKTNFCLSDSLNHIWNYVNIDGKWYHVDVTWDDPVSSDAPTVEAYHNNFMISDETRMAITTENTPTSDPNDWKTYLSTKPDCKYKNFESEYLFNIYAPFNITYDGEYFKAPCTYLNGNGGTLLLTFRSKSLHSGVIATTDFTPYILTSSTKVSFHYYYCVLSDYSGSVTPISLNVDNGQYKSFVLAVSLPLSKYNTYSDYIFCDTTSDYTDIFFWNIETLMPACEKTRIVH